MGEKIKILSELEIFNTDFEIELNHPPRDNQEQQIHIQSDNLRLEFDKSEYMEYCLLVLLAERNLKRLKNII